MAVEGNSRDGNEGAGNEGKESPERVHDGCSLEKNDELITESIETVG